MIHNVDTRARRDQLGELLMDAECRRHADGDMRVRRSGLRHETRNVARDMFARRQHVGKRDDLAGAGGNALGHTRGDRRLGQLHVRVADDDVGPTICCNRFATHDSMWFASARTEPWSISRIERMGEIYLRSANGAVRSVYRTASQGKRTPPVTSSGVPRGVVVPSPSSPSALAPQHIAVLPPRTNAQV
jgi:hypothetical protein